MVHHIYDSSLVVEVNSKKHLDQLLMELKDRFLGRLMSHSPNGYLVLIYQGIFCVPTVDDLRSWILEEAHGACYSIYLGSTNMYHDLREVFLWDGLKRDILRNLLQSV